MHNLTLRILLVDDSPTDLLLLEEALMEMGPSKFALTRAKRLGEALKYLTEGNFDAVLLDLGLPDSQGFETFARMQREHPAIPILIVSNLDDEDLSVRTVQNGAQDYLVKGTGNGTMLARNIRYAIERKRSEQKLVGFAMGYRRLFETAQDGIFILDAGTGQITDANPYIETLLGYTITEFIGKRLWEIGPFRDKAASQAAFATLQEKGYIRYEDLPLEAKTGRIVNVEFVSNVYAVGDQQVIQCNVRDITDRKLREVATRASEERYRALSEVAPDDIFIVGRNGILQYINKNGAKKFGLPPEALIGKSQAEIFVPETVEHTLIALCKVFESAKPLYEEARISFQNREVWLSTWLIPLLNSAGEVHEVMGVARDITEQKQAAEALRKERDFIAAVIDTAGSLVLVLDLQRRIVRFNRACEQLTGYTFDEVKDRDFFALLLAPEEMDRVKVEFENLCSGNFPNAYENYLMTKDGKRRLISWSNTVLLDEGNSVEYVIGTGMDVTERRQAEEEKAVLLAQVEQQRQRLDTIVASVPGMVWEAWGAPNEAEQNTDFISDYVTTMLGYSVEEWLGTPAFWLTIVHPDDRERVEREAAAIYAGGKGGTTQFRWLAKDGRVVWAESQKVVICDPAGLPFGMRGVSVDITERKRAEEDRDRFFTMSLDMLCIAGSDGYFKRLNPAFEATLGYSIAELTASPFFDFVHPDDQAATVASMELLASGADLTKFVNRYRCRDGSYKWIEWAAAPFEELLYAAARDITLLKQAEADLVRANDELEMRVLERTVELYQTNQELQLQKTILESQGEASIAGTLVVSGEGKFVSYNRRFLEMFGIAPDLLSTNSDEKILHSILAKLPDPDAFLVRVAYLYEHPDEQSHEEIHLNDGRSLDRYSAPVQGTDGTYYGRIWFFHDITERKQSETLIHQAREEADRANKAKSEFLSRMSHELRTPLNAILGFGQILDRGDLTPNQKESVGHILKGGRHLLTLINEVLDIARVEAGHVELSVEPIALSDVIPESCALVRPLADERNIRLVENSATLVRYHVLADRQRLKQVLINLLSNSIKYNRVGGQVEVSSYQIPHDRIRIAVRDTGAGIAADDLPKLFTPFERLSAANSNIEGTGLGLALSQRLVAAMGGKLGVESILGQGSTFTIDFPMVASPVERLSNLPGHGDSADTVTAEQRNYTALCIEDNLSNLRLIEAILESRPKITLLSAMQGSMGLDLARQHNPDVILLDLNLPDISGKEVLARLRQSAITRDIPVIVISADATPTQIQRLLAAGARAYLTKPLDVGRFLEVVDEVLLEAGVSNDL